MDKSSEMPMIGIMERLKRWLSETSTTQKALGETLGVKQPTVSDWVSGETSPSIDNLRELSRVTGISIDELLDVPKKPKSQQSRHVA
jgi:transcriptional regulator with XRE-family HTH domain